MKSEKYTISNFESLFSKFVAAKDSGDPQKFCEILDQIGKMLIWGERQDSDLFQFFCEVKALDTLLQKFSKAKSREIVIGIIGFFNMLFTNLNKIQNINCLLSHPCVLSLQNIKFVALDNQIAQYYINFLKQLSRKLNCETLHLFYNKVIRTIKQRYPAFPLLMQTTRFYNHPQNLVRTTCRNILLSSAKLKSPKMTQFINGFPFCVYYINECNFIKQYWYIMDQIVESEDNQYQLQNLQSILQDHEQLLYFMEDFMQIDPVNITNRFIDAFSNQCMSYLIQSFYQTKKTHFSIKVSLFISNILIKIITNKQFLDFIAFAFFGRYYPEHINMKLMYPVDRPLSYSKQWKFKGFWDSHQDQIQQYCLNKNFPQTTKEETIRKSNITNLPAQEYQRKKYSSDMRSIFGMGTNFYGRETDKLQNIFGFCLREDNKPKKPMSLLFSQLKESIANDNLDITKCQNNPVRSLIFSFSKSKDDQLVFLTLNLIHQIANKKLISDKIIEFCSLSPEINKNDFKSMSDIEQIIKSCLNVFETDPPAFRICTYKLAQSLIVSFCKIYQGQINKIPKQLLEMAKEAIKGCAQRIKPYLYQQKEWEISLSLFNTVTEADKSKKIKTLITYGFMNYEENKNNRIEQIYDCLPRNPQQAQARDFWLYIIMRDTYCQFTKTVCKYEVNICDEKTSNKASKFQIGSPYVIQEDHFIECKHRELHEQKSTKCSLILLGGYVVIGENNLVKFKASYQQVVVVIDRSDPRNLMIEFNENVSVLSFENAKQAYDIKKRFQDMKSLVFQYQLSILVKQIEWMLERANSD